MINRVVVTFWWDLDLILWWWGIDFLLWDIDFFGFMGTFGYVGFGYGKFLDMWFWLWEFFRTCGFGHGNFFFLGMFWVVEC